MIKIEGKKIGLCGAHRVGKTTLAKKISKRTGLTYIPETARDMLEVRGYDENWRNISNQDYFEAALFYSHLWYIKSIESFVSDRTIFDIYAYTLIGNIACDWRHIFKKLSYHHKDLYDVVLFYKLPGYTKQETDDQSLVQMTLTAILNEYKVDFIEIKKRDTLNINGIDINI